MYANTDQCVLRVVQSENFPFSNSPMSQVSTEDPSTCLCLHPQSAKMHFTLSLQCRFAKGHLSEPVSGRRQPGHLSMWFGVGMAGTRDTQQPLNTDCWCFIFPSINPEPEQSPNGSVPKQSHLMSALGT